MKKIASNLQEVFEKKTLHLMNSNIYDKNNLGERALLEKLLNYLVLINSVVGIQISKKISVSEEYDTFNHRIKITLFG